MSGAKKKNTNMIPRWKKIVYFLFHTGFIFFLGTGLIFAHDMIIQSNTFFAEKVIVKGNKRLNRSTVLHTADISENESIIRMNLKLIRKRLVHSDWIDDCSIKREFPDKIKINIKEHTPAAKIKLNRTYLLNNEGRIFKKADKNDLNTNIPEIHGLNIFDVNNQSKELNTAMSLIKTEKDIYNTGLFTGSSKIVMDKDIGVKVLNTNLCKKMILGFNDFEDKFHNLRLINIYFKRKFPDKKIDQLDLSRKKRVVITPFPARG